MSEPTTIAERYGRAINSSDLRVRELRQSDADVLIAAGWSDSLGILLYRLLAEYDQVARDLQETAANNATELLLIAMRLKTLGPAKAELGKEAVQAATKRRFMVPDREVYILVGRVLASWLDPLCHKCHGIGKIGGYDGQVQHTCRACGGTGKTRTTVGRTDDEKVFASYLFGDMDRRLAEAQHHLRTKLRTR